jgi:hypothetical protein
MPSGRYKEISAGRSDAAKIRKNHQDGKVGKALLEKVAAAELVLVSTGANLFRILEVVLTMPPLAQRSQRSCGHRELSGSL